MLLPGKFWSPRFLQVAQTLISMQLIQRQEERPPSVSWMAGPGPQRLRAWVQSHASQSVWRARGLPVSVEGPGTEPPRILQKGWKPWEPRPAWPKLGIQGQMSVLRAVRVSASQTGKNGGEGKRGVPSRLSHSPAPHPPALKEPLQPGLNPMTQERKSIQPRSWTARDRGGLCNSRDLYNIKKHMHKKANTWLQG